MPCKTVIASDFRQESTESLSKIAIPAATVEKYLKALDPDKGAGSDGIPPFFWLSTARTLSYSISLLFNMSLNKITFPSIWKRAHIVPIHKKGSKSKIENYRGISILNTIGKVFEKIVFDVIYPTVCKEIPPNQHGSLKRRSTITNLACFTNYVLSNMERGGQIDVIYTDFEKALDRVDHGILIRKLRGMGIH